MPRKPNYRFERMERERAKAAKKAARAEAKRLQKEDRQKTADEGGDGVENDADISPAERPSHPES